MNGKNPVLSLIGKVRCKLAPHGINMAGSWIERRGRQSPDEDVASF